LTAKEGKKKSPWRLRLDCKKKLTNPESEEL
jgi:hypothetical protein